VRDEFKENILFEMQRKKHEEEAFPNLADNMFQTITDMNRFDGEELLTLDVDEPGSFDYDTSTSKYSFNQIKSMIVKQI